MSAYVFDAGPTTAQIAAKNAYCTRCADAGNGGDNCAGYFGSKDAGGIGSVVLFSSDSVAAAVTNDCKACDILFYPLCTAGDFCSGLQKDPCGKGVCK